MYQLTIFLLMSNVKSIHKKCFVSAVRWPELQNHCTVCGVYCAVLIFHILILATLGNISFPLNKREKVFENCSNILQENMHIKFGSYKRAEIYFECKKVVLFFFVSIHNRLCMKLV